MANRSMTGDGIRRLGVKIQEISQSLDMSQSKFKSMMTPVIRELHELNEQARLQGIGKNGKSLTPVTYRPKPTTDHQRSNSAKRKKGSARNAFGNLTPQEYRRLDGPPLVPRRKGSRLISNFYASLEVSRGSFRVKAGWKDIRDRKGRPFFPGISKNGPKREVDALTTAMTRRLMAVVQNTVQSAIKGK